MRRSLLLVLMALAGCGSDPAPQAAPPRDPQVARALYDPLMTDPDLSSRNEAAAALTVEADDTLPLLPATPEAIALARADAAEIAGGTDRLVALPSAKQAIAAVPSRSGADAHLATLPTTPACRANLQASAVWAARLPALPVYPRGAVQAGWGRDVPGCRVRAVAFTTPVSSGDVLAFYAQRARMSGLSAVHYSDTSGDVLRGAGEGLAYDLRVAQEGDHARVRLALALR